MTRVIVAGIRSRTDSSAPCMRSLNLSWCFNDSAGMVTDQMSFSIFVRGLASVFQLLKSPTIEIDFAFGAHSRMIH